MRWLVVRSDIIRRCVMSTTFVKTPSITFSIDSPICAKKFYQSNVPLNGYRLSVNKGKAALAKTALAKPA
jgi:hypothetical protein